jgi:hypothetical protein
MLKKQVRQTQLQGLLIKFQPLLLAARQLFPAVTITSLVMHLADRLRQIESEQ